MEENNLQKKPRDSKEYANLFLLDENGKKRDFSGVNSVCFVTVGHAETLWILLQEFASKDITIIDRKSEIDFIEALKKLHNRDDIRIVQKIEVEKDEDVLNNYIRNTNMFDLIIANPPYGNQGACLAKKINSVLVNFAEQTIVLAPVRSFLSKIENLDNEVYLGNLSSIFPDANCPAGALALFRHSTVNKYKDIEDLVLTTKHKILVKAIANYNEMHEPFFTSLLGYCTSKQKASFHGDESLIFVVTNWCAADKVHANKSADRDHNLDKKPLEWKDSCKNYGIVLKDKDSYENFTKWWYKTPGRGVAAQKTLIYKILEILALVGNGGPSINKYPKYFPNLDWSYPWTDQEILKEIGLPEDFLEKE